MADSTADATAENADTLKQKLTKLLTEILDDGGGSKDRSETGDGSFDVLKSIDEAIRVLTCMRKVESKKPESDIPSSSSVVVPKEFKCPLSNEIMIEPVIISSGQTYEKKYIKTAIPHVVLTPNHLVDDLITQWCRVNGYDRRCEERVTELSTNGIDSLLRRILSPSSVSDQTEAADELRRQTKKFANVRDLFVDQIPYSITRMLSPLSALGEVADLNPELHKNLVATLFNISIVEKHKTVIAINPLVIPVLAKSLKTVHTRRVSASTLWSLSIVDSNKLIIGNSEALMALIGAIEGGDVLATTAAASTVYNLCIVSENRERAVSAGLIPVLTNKIKSGKNVVDELFAVLALISTHKRAIEEMEDLGFINDLLSILRRTSDAVIAENAIVIVFNMCDRIRDLPRVNVLTGEENQYGTFSKLAASQGSDLTVRKAETILQWFKRYG